VDTINYMIDQVAEGKIIFYNFYTFGRWGTFVQNVLDRKNDSN
jgi:hypothetical protein